MSATGSWRLTPRRRLRISATGAARRDGCPCDGCRSAPDAGLRRCGALQRKKLLAKLDGLTNPRERQSSRSARRRLEREVEREEMEAEWMAGALRGAPPVSQDAIDLLVRQGEVRRIEVSHLRLREWERKSPIHGETL